MTNDSDPQITYYSCEQCGSAEHYFDGTSECARCGCAISDYSIIEDLEALADEMRNPDNPPWTGVQCASQLLELIEDYNE